jgi:uncharacterized membrane protein
MSKLNIIKWCVLIFAAIVVLGFVARTILTTLIIVGLITIIGFVMNYFKKKS